MNQANGNTKSGIAAGALITAAVCLLALPSAVMAFSVKFEPAPSAGTENDDTDLISGEEAPANLAQSRPMRSLAKGKLYPFTPAGTPDRPDRSVTVAVRVDGDMAQAFAARAAVGPQSNPGEGSELRIAPTAFNLGVSRGYANFAQNIVNKDKDDKQPAVVPNPAKFGLTASKPAKDPRFSPRIIMDETQSAGRAPRTFAGDSDDLVDLGGSYRLSKNLDVTAGVRYSEERERLVPLTDGKQDNQAVYLGTQFRF